MVDPRWSFRPRRHYYLVGAAGLIAASGWLFCEPRPGATQSAPAGASGAYTQPNTAAPRTLADDAPAVVTAQRGSMPPLLAVTVLDPADDSAERRLAALVQAPKHGPPL